MDEGILSNRVKNAQFEAVAAYPSAILEASNTEKKTLPVCLNVFLYQFESRQAVFMLDNTLSIVYLNENANNLIAKSDGLTKRKQQLVLEDHSAHVKFESITQMLTKNLNQSAFSNSLIAMRPSDNLPLYIRVSPVKGSNSQAIDCHHVIVQVEEPECSFQSPRDYLVRHYNLTQREVDVANKIFDGLNAKAIAQTLHLTHETVRQYIKTILKKTGNKKQLELVRLMYFLARPQFQAQEITLTKFGYDRTSAI
jgi:DNA-binding CsgD family transcriptional regulator